MIVVKLGGDPEKVEAALIEEIDKVLADGITERELQKSRNQVAVSTVLEQTTVAGKAQRLGYAAVVLGDIDQVNQEYEDLIEWLVAKDPSSIRVDILPFDGANKVLWATFE